MIDYFSLKGWGARKIQKKLTDTLGSDLSSQAEISRWLARFRAGNISCLDEARPGALFSILGPPLEHFLEKFPFASARTIAMHFNLSRSTVKDILSQELGL
jgi:transposase